MSRDSELSFIERQITDFGQWYGQDTLNLLHWAALPPALDAHLIHFLRINFCPELPYESEAKLLLSPLCRPISAELFVVEPSMRRTLLKKLEEKDGRALAYFLFEYYKQPLPILQENPNLRWAHLFTALGFLMPEDTQHALQRLVKTPTLLKENSFWTALKKKAEEKIPLQDSSTVLVGLRTQEIQSTLDVAAKDAPELMHNLPRELFRQIKGFLKSFSTPATALKSPLPGTPAGAPEQGSTSETVLGEDAQPPALLLDKEKINRLAQPPSAFGEAFHKIALWGVESSGKTWLLKAFIAEANYYNRQLKYPYRYSFKDSHGKILRSGDMPEGATFNPYDIFIRVACHSKKAQDPSMLLLWEHNIQVHEGPGGLFTNTILNPGKKEANLQMALAGLHDAESLIVLIDLLPVVSKELLVDPSMYNTVGTLREYIKKVSGLLEQGYLNMLWQLLDIIKDPSTSHGRERRNLALCLSKIDQLKISSNPPEYILRQVLGSEVNNLLASFKDEFNFRLFKTSAMGFFQDEQRGKVHNYDPEKNVPFPDRDWIPNGASAPFFWVFEQIAQAELKCQKKPTWGSIKYPGKRKP